MLNYAQQASYLQEVAELKKMFPDVDFDQEWILVDVQGWSDWEEGSTYWLLEHAPSEVLYQLDDIHSVMGKYEVPLWSDKFETTLEEWFRLIHDVDRINNKEL